MTRSTRLLHFLILAAILLQICCYTISARKLVVLPLFCISWDGMLMYTFSNWNYVSWQFGRRSTHALWWKIEQLLFYWLHWIYQRNQSYSRIKYIMGRNWLPFFREILTDLDETWVVADEFRCGFYGSHMTAVLIVTELGHNDFFIKGTGCSYCWDTHCCEFVFSCRSHRYNAVFWYMKPCSLIQISSQSRLSGFYLTFFTRTYCRPWLWLWFLFEDYWKEVQIGALDPWFESSPT
jgi:hypothetical protein